MTNYYTTEGLDKLKKELADREGSIRADIAKRILEAKELGDLSENAEYAEAREAQSINEGRIEEIKEIIRSAVIIDHPNAKGGISIGSTVKIKSGKIERTLVIVAPSEAQPQQGFISYEAPIGAALIGRKKGDDIEVLTPSGKVKYSIAEVK